MSELCTIKIVSFNNIMAIFTFWRLLTGYAKVTVIFENAVKQRKVEQIIKHFTYKCILSHIFRPVLTIVDKS